MWLLYIQTYFFILSTMDTNQDNHTGIEAPEMCWHTEIDTPNRRYRDCLGGCVFCGQNCPYTDSIDARGSG